MTNAPTIITDVAAAEQLLLVRWEMASRDPLVFLRHFVWTCDQHDKDNPVKQFPVDRVYIPVMTNLWEHNLLLVIAKSRQMMMTWLFCALYLWDTMFHQGRLTILQSKREDDAIGNKDIGSGLMGRSKFILEHIPGRQLLLPKYTEKANELVFPELNSALLAIPQGANIIRQQTASGIFSDEAAFQEEFEQSYVAATPCLRGGGRMTVLSTPNPGSFMQKLYHDDMDAE